MTNIPWKSKKMLSLEQTGPVLEHSKIFQLDNRDEHTNAFGAQPKRLRPKDLK